jgi:hypothetical protein
MGANPEERAALQMARHIDKLKGIAENFGRERGAVLVALGEKVNELSSEEVNALRTLINSVGRGRSREEGAM